MATVITNRGQSFTVPDETLQSHLENGFTDASAAHVQPTEYSTLKVGQLRDILRDRGLPTEGTKPELIEQLVASDAAAAAPADEDELSES